MDINLYKLFLVEKTPFILNFLHKSSIEDKFSIITFSTVDKALQSIENYNPHLIVLTEDAEEVDLLSFCRRVRENYSLVLPLLLVVNFYSSLNLIKFKNWGVDFIVRPFTLKEFTDKIEYLLFKQNEVAYIDIVQEPEHEFIDKLRSYIKEEVRVEMLNLLKLLMENMERKHA